MGRFAHQGLRGISLLVGALLAGLPTTAVAADPPIDPALPVPTLVSGQDCGSSSTPVWDSTRIPAPEGMTFTIGVPRPVVNGVRYQGIVHAWDVDDPAIQADGEVDGLPLPSQSVYVPLSPADGHTYAWSAQTSDGTASSPATSTCYFTIDSGRPVVTSITNPDFPQPGTEGTPRKPAGQPTTFTIRTSDVLPAGCTTAGGPGCRMSGVKSFTWSMGEPPPVGSTTYPVDSSGEATLTLTPAWGSHVLYVYAVDGAGNRGEGRYAFTVPSQLPPPAASTIQLSAPVGSTRATKLVVSGRVSPGTYTPDEVVHITRTDLAHPGGVALPDAPLSADGSFRFGDTPQVGGDNTYRVGFDGDALQQAASASVTVQVSRLSPALTLGSHAHTYPQNSTPTVTAHLGSTHNGRTVAIYAQPVSGRKTLVKSGRVDAKGNLAVAYKLARTTAFTAVFAGDYQYAPRTVGLTVAATPRVVASLKYSGGTVHIGKTVYQVFHRRHHRPVLQAKASLAQASGCYQATTQRYVSHAWHTVRTSKCLPVGKNGYSAYTVPWSSLPVNGRFRIRMHYTPPRKAALGTAAWSAQAYFTIKAH
ncbi:hypothetical protein ACIQGZ_00705 [Streptomyces sp. NPDC092296]|uniref:hypothetical protein n=1 Tax=Streptomyces sp. NPDC092296 TaxID=3366012 RepID=UPI0038216FC1